jgi:hypothetical protein
MTTSHSPAAASPSSSNGEYLSSLPRWRQFLSTLNWRRDPGYELRMLQYEQRKMQHELRMKQLKSEIEQIKKASS